MINLLEAEHSLTTTFATRLLKPTKQAIREFNLLQAGDRIAVCLSGGKDSFVLAKLLQLMQKQEELPFSLTFLSMDPGYTPAIRTQIEANAARLQLPLAFFETNILRVAANHAPDHPCFLCAKMRRGHLYAQAAARGCNKIALGHHFDDAIETVLMGLLYGGQIEALQPRVISRHYPGMELIRPLYYVREEAVQAWAAHCELHFPPCSCPSAQRESESKRTEIKRMIASLAAQNPQIEVNLLNAVKNVDTKKLLGWRDAHGSHSFMEAFSPTEI